MKPQDPDILEFADTAAGQPADGRRTRRSRTDVRLNRTGGYAEPADGVEREPGRCRVQITKVEAADSEPGEDGGGDENSITVEGKSLEVVEEMDVRNLPPAQRHQRIFAAYDELSGGDGFVLVNDHDPKPLYHQFDAEAGAAFRWAYLQRDHGEFRVLIGKADGVESEPIASDEPKPPF